MLYENREGLKGQDAEDASTYRKIVEYLAASKAIKTNLFIHSVVVSEFASTYLRLSFRADWLRKNGKPVPPFHATVRKAYIKEEDDGKLAVRTIAKICQGILKSYKALEREDGLNTKEMGKITAKYAQGGMEFNDCIIANICRNHNLALLTNDGDFANTQGFPIVTARSSLKKNRER
jgi:predicted nucleic acid-binding protein